MDDITKKWVERAKYDLATADAMFVGKRYLYVAFMCQQALEKMMKAIIISQNGEVLRTHNLVRLAELSGVSSVIGQSNIEFLSNLTPFAVESRYGDYRCKLSEIINKKTAFDYLEKTKTVFKWLKKRIESQK
ncbi:MAG: HEPN domain-containing protein [Candidatus Omnitrophota bacterium]|jgi:HEPN domain-containing protein